MELMQEHLPSIYGKFTRFLEVSSALHRRSTASKVVRPVHDGGRDTTVSEESKPREQAAEGPPVSWVNTVVHADVVSASASCPRTQKVVSLKTRVGICPQRKCQERRTADSCRDYGRLEALGD